MSVISYQPSSLVSALRNRIAVLEQHEREFRHTLKRVKTYVQCGNDPAGMELVSCVELIDRTLSV